MVLKPSEVAPLASIELMRRIADETSLPDGVLNFVTGAGDVGAVMVRSPMADLITMTGHRDTGKKIMAEAAPNLTRVSLELGGKAPAIVMADADIDLAVRELVTARQTNTGQVCTCAERTFVERRSTTSSSGATSRPPRSSASATRGPTWTWGRSSTGSSSTRRRPPSDAHGTRARR